MRTITACILISVLLLQVSCKGKEILTPGGPINPNDGTISVWKTSHDGSFCLYKLPTNLKIQASVNDALDIAIDVSKTKQEMEGFGASLTGSSAYVLMNSLSAFQRQVCLKDLFSTTTGIGLSYLRLTMGASDFSLSNFTYNDIDVNLQDTAMVNFSLATEDQYLVPVLKEILAINPDVKILGSPWSAPAWMKSNKKLIQGGKVQAQFYKAYAMYFVKYIQAFKDRGINIDAITIQNEPLYAAPYMSTEMSAYEQSTFIKEFLGPAFQKYGLLTKIIIYDHNWDRTDYPLATLADADARKYIAGSAFHCYGGNVSAMSQVANAYPDKGIYFTECSGGNWATDFGSNLEWNIENLIIGAPRNHAKTVLFWNLALDENFGPKNGGCQDCRGVVTVNSVTKNVDRNIEYFVLGHTSKFLKLNAELIETADTRNQGISNVAYLNTDGSKVMLAYNHLSTIKKVQVIVGDKYFNYSIQPGELITFVW